MRVGPKTVVEPYPNPKNSPLGPKTVVKPYPSPKNAPLGPQKVNNNPKIK